MDFSSSTTAVAIGGLVAPFLVLALIRLFFHPLAKYPGPFWGRVTDWYTVYHAYVGDRHWDFHELHRKYGPIVRFGPNRLSILSVTALRDINLPKANTTKGDMYRPMPMTFGAQATLTTTDKVEHARRRRILSQGLSLSAVESFQDHIIGNVKKFCHLLLEHNPSSNPNDTKGWSSAKDLLTLTSWLGFDVMGSLCFNRSFDLLTSEKYRRLPKILEDGVKCMTTVSHMLWLLKLPLNYFLPTLNAGLDTFKRFSTEQSRDRIAKKNDASIKDVFHYLLSSQDNETGTWLTHEELASESGLLIIAGSDTTSFTITATIHYLLKNPIAMDCLSYEILATFASPSEIRIGSKLSSCTYLRACIDEALRMSPPVSAILERVVLPGGLQLDGHFFPEGTILGVPHYAMHRDPTYYEDPFAYRPERWIVDPNTAVTEAGVSRAKSAFCTFGNGRTSCIGKNVAYAEVSITLATMLMTMEMKLAENTGGGEAGWNAEYHQQMRARGELPTKEMFTSTAQGPWVCFRLRK